MTAANPNYDQIFATTLAKHRSRLTDNVWKKRVFTDRLLRSGRIEEDGGTKIVEPLIYQENGTVDTFSGWDRIDLTPQEGISAAEYLWRSFAGSVAINQDDEDMNSGSSGLIKLVKTKIEQLENSKSAVLNRMLHGDTTGINSAKAFNSLPNLISATTTFGGINPATSGNEFWKSTVIDAASPTYFNSKLWANAFYQASAGIDGPTMGMTTVELFQAYEESMLPQLRYTQNDKADARFRNLDFKGIPMFFDIDNEDGTTYFPNEKNIKLVTHSKRWMTPTGFREVPDQVGRWNLIVSKGQLVTNCRRGSAKVINQSSVVQVAA